MPVCCDPSCSNIEFVWPVDWGDVACPKILGLLPNTAPPPNAGCCCCCPKIDPPLEGDPKPDCVTEPKPDENAPPPDVFAPPNTLADPKGDDAAVEEPPNILPPLVALWPNVLWLENNPDDGACGFCAAWAKMLVEPAGLENDALPPKTFDEAVVGLVKFDCEKSPVVWPKVACEAAAAANNPPLGVCCFAVCGDPKTLEVAEAPPKIPVDDVFPNVEVPLAKGEVGGLKGVAEAPKTDWSGLTNANGLEVWLGDTAVLASPAPLKAELPKIDGEDTDEVVVWPKIEACVVTEGEVAPNTVCWVETVGVVVVPNIDGWEVSVLAAPPKADPNELLPKIDEVSVFGVPKVWAALLKIFDGVADAGFGSEGEQMFRPCKGSDCFVEDSEVATLAIVGDTASVGGVKFAEPKLGKEWEINQNSK